MQFLWTVVTCLLKNVEHEIEHVLDSANEWSFHTLSISNFNASLGIYTDD